jgi:RNA polymerase sigma-70 factor (ECF subfamily)
LSEADHQRETLRRALRGTARGDQAALRQVYDLTSAKLFGICMRILHDTSEAEDVLQEVYITVWKRADRFDPERASPITWLAAIARNRAIDKVRARRPGRSEPMERAEHVADAAASAEEAVIVAGENARLFGCLDELEPQHRSAVRTAFLDGKTYEELALAAGVPLGTMKSWIRRSLMRLRACLER